MALQRIAAPSLPILTSLNGTKRTGVALNSDVYQIGTLILDCACVLPTQLINKKIQAVLTSDYKTLRT